jgi:hypothetical protein
MSLSYNGIDFVYPLTTLHQYGPVKDPSGSDQLYTKVQLTAETLLNAAFLPARVQDANPSQVLANVRHALTQPRGALYYDLDSLPGQTGNSPLINIPDGRDDGTGPWPDDSAIRVIYTTQNTLSITWSCTVLLRDCGGDTTDQPLSLRWQDSLSFDNTGKATYSRNGTLIISSKDIHSIDWYRRNALSAGVAPGFRRTSSKYTSSSDGLRCDFTFADEQTRITPPGNAVDIRITQSETAPIGPIRKGTCVVRLTGLQNSNPVDLARWALIILNTRLNAARPLLARIGASAALIGNINLSVTEDTAGVEAEATVSYKTQPDPQRQQAVLGAVGWAAAVGAGFQNATPNPTPTQQGKTPGIPLFPWVGVNTSPVTAGNPAGFATWANPTGAINPPADGLGTASSIALFAAILRDPCGAALVSTPDAGPVEVELRTNQNTYNTPAGGGQGGTPAVAPAQLSVAVASIPAAQYPTSIATVVADGLWVSDGLPGVYDFWQTSDEYADDPGVLVVPSATPGGTNVAISYASAQFSLYRRWTARRTGAPPELPPRTVNKPSGDVDPNWVYVGGNPAPALRDLGVAADGVNIVYEASGVYIFQALDASLVSPSAPVPPFMDSIIGASAARWYNAELVAEGVVAAGAFDSGPFGALLGLGGGPLGSLTTGADVG